MNMAKETSASRARGYIRNVAFLLIILLVLIYVYYLFTRPPTPVGVAPKPKGIAHVFSIYGFGGDRLSEPTDVAVDKQGNIYVADTNKHRVLVFNKNGKFRSVFGKEGTGRGEINLPSGLAVDPGGNIYVLCKTLDKIVVFNKKQQVINEIHVEKPMVATVAHNRLYLATHRGVMIGDLKGNLLSSFGRRGRAKGRVDFPGGIAVDKKGNIYVADTLNLRLEAFSPEGEVLWVEGKPAEDIKAEKRRFGLPVGLTIGDNEYLYLVDAFHGTIRVITTKGRELANLGEWGHEDGQLYLPAGIAYAGDDRFVVADKYNDRVQMLRVTVSLPGAPLLIARWLLNPYVIAVLILVMILVLTWMLYRRWRRQRAQEEQEEQEEMV